MSSKVTIYMKPEDLKRIEDCGHALFREGYPVLDSGGNVNRSAVISTILRLTMGVEVVKVSKKS